ncbi:hypothetical protein Q8F55_003250 [Vanrija albida]|uniref:alpha-galactosidase n=1 Tax=Vanrija albida TaxID=181172 RepID=A0ABR3QC01_9TREE
MVLVGIFLLFLIPLAVGLGVGLDPRRERYTRTRTSSTIAPKSTTRSSLKPSATPSVKPSAPAPVTTPGSLWQPQVGASWQIMLGQTLIVGKGQTVTPNVDIYDVDLFDTSAETIAALHDLGKHVICYFSAGSYEAWRPDAAKFAKTDLGSGVDGWAGENWVKTGSSTVRAAMTSRIALAASKGCDAIDPDNVDAYNNGNGLGLTTADAVDFVKFLAATAAKYNMSTGLKNAGDIIPSVVSSVAFSVNEQCAEYRECDKYSAFVNAGKPVFHIEYPGDAPNPTAAELTASCTASGAKGFSTVLKNMSLDKWVKYCNGQTA